MLTFDFAGPGVVPAGPLRVLALGAHPDDIEIGCGGTLVRLATERPGCELRWVVLSGGDQRGSEARASAAGLVPPETALRVDVHDFRDGHLPFQGSAVKDALESVAAGFEPDLILTHRREDLHQDHRFVAELTWQTFRRHTILEYEVPKYDGDLGPANLYVTLPEAVCRQKVDHVLAAFPSQQGRHWFSADTFWAVLRLRGVEANAETPFAEAFTCRKVVI